MVLVGPVESGENEPLPESSPVFQHPMAIRLGSLYESIESCPRCSQTVDKPANLSTTTLTETKVVGVESCPPLVRSFLPWFMRLVVHSRRALKKGPVLLSRLHLHLLSDSTGETLEMIAKAALAQFEATDVVRHFWPMVRSQAHLDRIVPELQAAPGLVLYTLVNAETRNRLEECCRQMSLPAVDALETVTVALEAQLGQEAHGRPGRQHRMDAAYFERVEAIQFTIAHDDGTAHENWEQADILLAGVSRSSKTPTSIYLANRGYKVANIPLVVESPPPAALYDLKGPTIVGLTTAPERLVQIRRNRLLTLNEREQTDYVDNERVKNEVRFARRLFSDNNWPVIDVTRRSIEETAAAIIRIHNERQRRVKPGEKPI